MTSDAKVVFQTKRSAEAVKKDLADKVSRVAQLEVQGWVTLTPNCTH